MTDAWHRAGARVRNLESEPYSDLDLRTLDSDS